MSWFSGFTLLDPSGLRLLPEIISSGFCFCLDFGHGQKIAYVLEWIGSDIFITAAFGNTTRHARAALAVIEQQAIKNGAQVLKFQTARPGLVKLAIQAGYTVHGMILQKVMRHESAP